MAGAEAIDRKQPRFPRGTPIELKARAREAEHGGHETKERVAAAAAASALEPAMNATAGA